MALTDLKHIHVVRRRLVSGQYSVHHYAWRGGPRLPGKPGSPEYLRAYQDAHDSRKQAPKGVFLSLISAYMQSPEYLGLGEHTTRAYKRHLDQIKTEFGDLPIKALEDKEVKRHFLKWRNTMAKNPRTADMATGVLKTVLTWCIDQVYIEHNHAASIKRLHKSNRSDKIVTAEQLEKLNAVASKELLNAIYLGLYSGLRQSNLIKIKWPQYDGTSISARSTKRNKEVLIPIIQGGRELLAKIPKRSFVILTNTYGQPWTADGLRSSFRKACIAAEVTCTFHDLRRTACTYLLARGIKTPQVAMIMGWSETDVEAMKIKYVSRAEVVKEVLAMLGEGG